MRLRDLTVAGALIAAGLIAFSVAADYLVDWVWFSSVGYRGIFRTVLVTKIVILFAVFFSSAAFIWGNGALSLRFSQHLPSVRVDLRIGDRPNTFSVFVRADQVSIGSLAVADADGAVAIALGSLIAIGEAGNWDLVLRFIYQVPYSQSDPLYGNDIGFYLFSLPAYVALKNWMLLTVVLSGLIASGVYLAHGDIRLTRDVDGCPCCRISRLGAVEPVIRDQGLVVWIRSLSAALWR